MSFFDSLASDPDHGGVTDEQMEKFFSEHPDLRPLAPVNSSATPDPSDPKFESGQTGVPPVGGVEGEPPTPPAEPPATPPTEPPATPPATPPVQEGAPPPAQDYIELDGQKYLRSQVQAAARFQQQLAGDPQLQDIITKYLAGGATVEGGAPATPAGEGSAPAGPPAELDLEDPSVKALYDLVQQQSNQIAQLSQGLQTTSASQMAQTRTQIDAQWRTASAGFAQEHNLEQNDIDALGQVAARLGVLPQLMRGIDPFTGAPSPPDPIVAFNRALEIALYMTPEYRDREFRRSVEHMQEEAKKRKLLGAVGGSQGSVARVATPAKAGTPESKKEMLQEVGAMMRGEWSDPAAN